MLLVLWIVGLVKTWLQMPNWVHLNQIQIGDDDTYDWFSPTGIEEECHK